MFGSGKQVPCLWGDERDENRGKRIGPQTVRRRGPEQKVFGDLCALAQIFRQAAYGHGADAQICSNRVTRAGLFVEAPHLGAVNFEWPAQVYSLCPRVSETGANALADVLAFLLGHGSEN